MSWDQLFMGMAYLTSAKSHDPRTRVGSVIATEDNMIVSVGYNGLPRGVAYSTAILSSLFVPILIPQWAAPTEGADPALAYRILSNVFITTLAWVSVAFYTSSRLDETEKEKLESFVETIKPPGPGWKQFGGSKTERKISPWSFIGWLAATAMIYALLHTIGSLLFGQDGAATLSALLFAICSILVHQSLKRISPD